jgi:hypothetical protein
VVLLVVRLSSWLRFSWRPLVWKVAEILLLCDQVALLERRSTIRPRLARADRVPIEIGHRPLGALTVFESRLP